MKLNIKRSFALPREKTVPLFLLPGKKDEGGSKTNRWSPGKSRYLPAAAIMLLIVVRLFHLSAPIELPHSWRQCETANYSLSFYKDGMNPLKPSVSWLGNHGVHLYEFPLVEWISATLYHFFGPDIIWDRLVSLAFFLGSAWYLFLFVQLLSSRRKAVLTLIIYLALPMGIYYSRAPMIDFSAIFFSHVMIYYFLLGFRQRRGKYIVTGVLAAIFACIIKVPYPFVFSLLVIYELFKNMPVKKILAWLPLLLVPAIMFGAWRYHVQVVNNSRPDWEFLKDLPKTDPPVFYYGTLDQRLQGVNWMKIHKTIVSEVCGDGGYGLFLVGLMLILFKLKAYRQFLLWLLGGVIYLLTFFNLNVLHNYYQIPFIALCAFFMAHGLDELAGLFGKKDISRQTAALALLLFFLITDNILIAERTYYRRDSRSYYLGIVVQEYTPPESLLVFALPWGKPQDPRFLFNARRNGWNINSQTITRTAIEELRKAGANFLVLCTKKPLSQDMEIYLSRFRGKDLPVNIKRYGFRLFDLNRPENLVKK
jgi:hypothetical protein